MKIKTLKKVQNRYGLTFARAVDEILAAAGEQERKYPIVIRKQKIPPELVKKAKKAKSFLLRWPVIQDTIAWDLAVWEFKRAVRELGG